MNLFKYVIVAFIIALISDARASEEHQVHYIGFNNFHQDNLSHSLKVFDDYIEKLTPIMKKHGMTLRVFDVKYGGSEMLKADILSFGSAPNMQAMQAFFQDPEFHSIFPELLSVIDEHQVVFTDNSLLPEELKNGHTLLALNWVKQNSDLQQLSKLESKLNKIQLRYGVSKTSEAQGLMSNKGLGQSVVETIPPSLLQVWYLRDAHGYFDNTTVMEFNKESKNHLSRTEDFWLKPRR